MFIMFCTNGPVVFKHNKGVVLIGVIRRRKDLDIALKRHWYRIPLRTAPKRHAHYLALYETKDFGKKGMAINYYARIKHASLKRRLDLLPEEKGHIRSRELYYKLDLYPLRKTPYKIENKTRRRISFGFTALEKLLKAKEVNELFDIIPLEELMKRYMNKRRLKFFHEFCLMEKGRLRYRLDFAIFCRKGKIAIECDNIKWHSLPMVKKQDRMRDRWLRSHGWAVFHFSEREIVDNPSYCLQSIRKTIYNLGGIRF